MPERRQMSFGFYANVEEWEGNEKKNTHMIDVAQIYVNLNPNPIKENPLRVLPTPARGTGTRRVDKVQPVPLPCCTLPVTRAGFITRADH
jgi:hypothetical protein